MKPDRGWQLILFAGVIVIGAILYRHVVRDRPPHEAMRNLSPDGTEFVTPLVKEAVKVAEDVAPLLPERASNRDAAASRRAWDEGNYEVVPAGAGVLVVENGYERREFIYSDMEVRRCRRLVGQCLFGPDFEAKVNAKLPSKFQQRGTSALDVRLNIGGSPDGRAVPVARKAAPTRPKVAPQPATPQPAAPRR